MATFISPQVVSALLGINLYATHELKDQYGLCFVVLCTSPILETIPQSILQIVRIVFYMRSSTVECGFEVAEEVGMYMHDSGNLSVIYLVQLVFANIFFPPVFFFLHTYIVVTPYQI